MPDNDTNKLPAVTELSTCLIKESIMIVYIVALFMLGFVSGKPEFHRVDVHYETVTIIEDVMLDAEENYILVTVGHVTEGLSDPTVNMHDFKAGFAAFKNIEEGKCTIEPVMGTMADVIERIDNIERGLAVGDLQKFVWDCSSVSMSHETLTRLAGDRIANFCNTYQSFFAKRITEKSKGRGIARRAVQSKTWCFGCWASCE